MKKVLIITYYWPPSGGAGVQRWLKFCKYLPQHGYEPFVVTLFAENASYPVLDESLMIEQKDINVFRTKSREILKLYGNLFGQKKVPYSGFSNVGTDGFLSRISRFIRGNYFLPDARKGWNNFAYQKAVDLIQEFGIDQVVTTGPPHSTHLIGLKLKANLGVNWVADFRDPWTDIYYYDALLLTARNKARDAEMERSVLLKSDLVFSVCPSNQKLLQSKVPSEVKHKIKILTNGFDEADFDREFARNTESAFRIIYTGTIAPTYDVKPILSVLKELNMSWKLVVAGNVYPQLLDWVAEEDLDSKIEYLGYLNHEEVLKILQSGDLLLHILPNTEQNKYGTTGKLFEYIGAKIPILNVGPEAGDAASFIDTSNSGQTFDRTQKKEILDFIKRIHSGELNFDFHAQTFERRHLTKRLADYLDGTNFK